MKGAFWQNGGMALIQETLRGFFGLFGKGNNNYPSWGQGFPYSPNLNYANPNVPFNYGYNPYGNENPQQNNNSGSSVILWVVIGIVAVGVLFLLFSGKRK